MRRAQDCGGPRPGGGGLMWGPGLPRRCKQCKGMRRHALAQQVTPSMCAANGKRPAEPLAGSGRFLSGLCMLHRGLKLNTHARPPSIPAPRLHASPTSTPKTTFNPRAPCTSFQAGGICARTAAPVHVRSAEPYRDLAEAAAAAQEVKAHTSLRRRPPVVAGGCPSPRRSP